MDFGNFNLGTLRGLVAASALVALPTAAQALMLEVTVENLAPQNSITFAPLRVGFHNGTYDAFNNGEAAGEAIISVAEGGSGDAWFPAFAAADPSATLGSVLDGGPLLPGGSATVVFEIDPTLNRFFTFAAMVVPSNDLFIGNDNPMQYELFDLSSNLSLSEITLFGRDIWDAGSEAADPANGAFVVGGMNGLRTPENDVVNFSFDELDAFAGLTTAAGYVFDPLISGESEIYRISFAEASPVPEPGTMGLMLLGSAALLIKRRRSVSIAS